MNHRFTYLRVVCLVILAWFFFAWLAAESLIVEEPLSKADAILILSGSSTYLERTGKAAEIYKKGIAPRILLTDDGERAGWSRREERNPSFVELARENLIESGVPLEAVEILPKTVDGTRAEADALQKKVEESGLKSVLLVTSGYHSRRVRQTFEKTFAENERKVEIGVETVAPGNQTPKPYSWWFSKNGWKFVAGEYAKIVYYWLYY